MSFTRVPTSVVRLGTIFTLVRRQLQKISSVRFGTVLPSILVKTLYKYPLKDQNVTFNVTLSLDSSEHCTVAMECSSSNDHTALCTTKNWHQMIKKFPKFTCIQIPMLYCQGRKCAPCGSMQAVEEGGTGSQQFTWSVLLLLSVVPLFE